MPQRRKRSLRPMMRFARTFSKRLPKDRMREMAVSKVSNDDDARAVRHTAFRILVQPRIRVQCPDSSKLGSSPGSLTH
jgi:hypothetical protein